MFPNQNNVYLHSTPSQELFARSRRDFSHGCIRVEYPVKLAVWVLRDQPDWTPERIAKAMKGGEPTQVNLKKAIPIMLIYTTASVDQNGQVRFFDDIYGHDTTLENALAAGYPYPA
jgi:murein L,D-transpeptidase YcbB/YkuD